MIEALEIKSTYKSPQIVLDPVKGEFSLQGNSILINVDEFYQPLLNWMDDYISVANSDKIKFIFDVKHFNVASTKRFLFLLYKLKELENKGITIEVEWRHFNKDLTVLETGEEFSQMIGLPFNFIGYEKSMNVN